MNTKLNYQLQFSPTICSPIKSKKKEVLAIIPARGGSKGLPRKNIKMLCGKPLIAYSIELALKSRLINRIIVSTEDKEIEEIAKHFGAEVPFLRPVAIAQDRSGLHDVMKFTLNKLSGTGYRPDIYITLYPTHPFRTLSLVDSLIKKNILGHITVRTVKKICYNNLSLYTNDDCNRLSPLIPSPHLGASHNRSYFRQYGLYVGYNSAGKKPPYNHVINDPACLIDIDTLTDFHLAEEILTNGYFPIENISKVTDSDKNQMTKATTA